MKRIDLVGIISYASLAGVVASIVAILMVAIVWNLATS